MLEISLIGAGRIGVIHAGNVAATGRARLRYVADVNAQAAVDLAAQHGAEVVDVETALNDPAVDGVIIASSTDTHAEMIEAAARAGKAIFCEKPVDLSLERVDRVVAVAEATGVPILIGFNRRFDPTLGGVQTAVAGGEIGALEMLTITSRDPSPPPAEYVARSGGLFADMMIHDFDLAHWILGGLPAQVYAVGSVLVDEGIGVAGDVETAMVTLTMADGRLCHIANSRRAVYGYDQRMEAFGAGGVVRAENHYPNALEIWDGTSSRREKALFFFLERYADAYRVEMAHFIDCVEGKATPLVSVGDGRAALVLADAAKRSLAAGTPVTL